MRPSEQDDRTRGYIILGFILTAAAVVAYLIYNAIVRMVASNEAEKRKAEAAAQAQADAAAAKAALVAKEQLCAANPTAQGCNSLGADRAAADAAAKAAAAKVREQARASAPCAEWEDAGSRGDPPAACRIWRIENGQTDECSTALANQPIWGNDFANDVVDKQYAAHAVKYCPIKKACQVAGIPFSTRPIYGKIYGPSEGCG